MRIIAFLLVLLGSITACKEKSAEPGEMPTLPSSSIFNLSSQWENQNGDTLHLTDLQGKTLVVVMIYSSCKTACPILIAKMKQIESKFDRKDIDKISMVLVSIDPETDTPEHL
ncbi:MAG TPA: SCO family protein, partial [Saprospiraceae bacterium]|nr:SCO family protein [Saprospiraceae bacterium]